VRCTTTLYGATVLAVAHSTTINLGKTTDCLGTNNHVDLTHMGGIQTPEHRILKSPSSNSLPTSNQHSTAQCSEVHPQTVKGFQGCRIRPILGDSNRRRLLTRLALLRHASTDVSTTVAHHDGSDSMQQQHWHEAFGCGD
jgi:hypothetical protein